MPNKENEGEGDVSGRKRISLACQRCRKRKIKCEPSGAMSDGQACVGCKAAKSNNCQYLRVNSDEVHCPSPEPLSGQWHLTLPTSGETSLSVVPAHDLSQYSINNFSQTALSTGRVPHRGANYNEGSGRNSSFPFVASPQGQFQSIPQQQPLGPDFYATYQGHHTLTYPNSVISPTSFVVQDLSPPWTSSSDCNPASTDSSIAQNNPIDYGTLQYNESTYVGAEIPSIRTEESPYFPGLSPLATNLPTPVSNNGRARCLPVPVQSYVSTSRGPNHASESSFSTATTHFTPETDSDTWTSATLLSDHNSSSVASSGGAESNSPPTTRETPIYEYASSLAPTAPGAGNMTGFSPLTLPTLHEPTEPQIRATGPNLETYIPAYTRLPTLDPPFHDPHHPSASIATVSTSDLQSSELNRSRTHRLLQPQPRRPSYSRYLFGSSSIEAESREGRKSAAVRRQERKYAGRHQ